MSRKDENGKTVVVFRVERHVPERGGRWRRECAAPTLEDARMLLREWLAQYRTFGGAAELRIVRCESAVVEYRRCRARAEAAGSAGKGKQGKGKQGKHGKGVAK